MSWAASSAAGRPGSGAIGPVVRKVGKNTLSAGSFTVTTLVAGAVGAAVVATYVVTSPTPSPERAQAIAAATAPRAPATPLVETDNGEWTDADLRYCREQATSAAEAASEQLHNAVSEGHVGLGGPSADVMERSAHLLCSATHKPLHLCRGYWHKQFLEAIKAYAAEFRGVSQEAYWASYNIGEHARQTTGQNDWETVTDDLRQTTRELARMRSELIAAFRDLIADGVIKPSEFGVFLGLGIPPDIAAMIGDARPLRDACG